MANADDILDNLSDEEVEEIYTKNTDIEEPIVIGLDRIIEVPDMLRRIAVQYDNKVETVTFDCPRYWDEHDLSTMNIYVNYLRSDTVKGRNLCKNIRVDEENPDLIHFDWTICSEVTEVFGKLVFMVCAMTTNDDGIEDLHWNSEINRQCYVSEALESDDYEVMEYADIINDILTKLENLYAANAPILDKSLTMEGFAADSKAVGDILRRFEESLMIEHFSEQFKYLYYTKKANEDTFELGEMWADGCMFDVRVNGFDLNKDEYTTNATTRTVKLKKPLDVIGTPVELLITRDVSIKRYETYEKLRGPQGPRGYSANGCYLDSKFDLWFTFEDGSEHNSGNIHTVSDIKIQNGQLHIEYTNGTSKDIGDLYDDEFIAATLKEVWDARDESIKNVQDQETASKEEIKKQETNAVNEIIQTKENSIAEVVDTKEEAIEEIESIKDSAVDKVNQTKDAAVKEVNDTKTAAVKEVNDTKTAAVNEVNETKDDALEEIDEARRNALGDINSTKDTAVDIVNQTKDSAVDKVNQTKDAAVKEVNDTKTAGVTAVKNQETKSLDELKKQEQTSLNNVKSQETSSVNEVNKTKEAALKEIKDQETASVNEVLSTKNDYLDELEEKKNDSIDEIDQVKDDAIDEFNKNKAVTDARIKAIEDSVGAPGGIAQLDQDGLIPASQLPSYVDDVIEGYIYGYSEIVAIAAIAAIEPGFYKDKAYTQKIEPEDGKIYIDLETNLQYRWSGSKYVEISKSLALGNTSSTAGRGDWTKTAYDHATAKGSAFQNGLYKITTNAQGHVTEATKVVKNDITDLGIPGENTTYGLASSGNNGLMSKEDKEKLDGIAKAATANTAATEAPKAPGTATVGSSVKYAREDHIHPVQTSVSGNAGTATKLQTPRKINGVDFDGSQDISITTVNGNAGTATKLQTPRNINGVAFDGSKDITITANPTSNQLTNQNLNDIKMPGFYYGAGGNTVTNKPNGDAFGLIVYQTAGGYTVQEYTNGNNNPMTKYIRQFSGSWSNWTQMKYTDTTYGAATESANGLMSKEDKIKVNNLNIAYATCSTAAGTKDKVANLTSTGSFELKVGTIVAVKFTNTNTYSSTADAPVTLNVDGTGAKPIYYNTTGSPTGTNTVVYGYANRTSFYMFDGTYWVYFSHGVDSNDNTVPSAYCTTAAGTAAKTASFTNYNLLAKSYLQVLIQNGNTAASAITLNINSKGAKPIYINGAASSTTNNALPAGTYLVYYDGTNYYFRTDGLITGSITGNAATVNGLTVQTAVPANAKFTDTNTWTKVSTSEDGYVTKLPGNTTSFLRGDGTWATPPNTTYTAATEDPKAPGTATVGTSTKYAREDHIHPLQTTVSGNAGTATKLATARTIATAGDVVGSGSFDGSGNLSITTQRRGCIVGQNASTATNPWYKFASISTSSGYSDPWITFKVTQGYGDNAKATGILTAHFRTNDNGSFSAGQLVWEYADESVTPDKFVMAYNTGSSPSIVELWVQIDAAYRHFHFDVIAEGNRTTRNTNLWTLYNTSSAGSQAAITSGYTQLKSTLNKILNTVSNADKVNNLTVETAVPANAKFTDTNTWTKVSTSEDGYVTKLPGNTTSFLRGDGTWATPPDNNTWTKVSTTADGYVTKLPGNTTSFLRGDGTWATPPNTTYTAATEDPKAPGTATVGTSTKYAREDHIHPLQTTVSGNAGSATKLQTARTIDGLSFNGSTNIKHYGACDTAGGTAAKEVKLLTDFTLDTGSLVYVHFKNTNTAAVADLTLNVNSTGAKPIKWRAANIPGVGYLSAARIYPFIYTGINWELLGDFNQNDNTYDRTRYQQNITAGTTAIVAANLIVADSNGYYFHLKSNKPFNIDRPILYAAGALAASAAGNNNYLCIPFTVTTTQSLTMIPRSPVFIKGKLSGQIFTPVNATPLTQTVPTTDDGYWYIYLGMAISGTVLYLEPSHPIYKYGSFGGFGLLSANKCTTKSTSISCTLPDNL